jgi:metallo-beta-lactamase family protein
MAHERAASLRLQAWLDTMQRSCGGASWPAGTMVGYGTQRKLLVKLHFLGASRQVTGSRYCLEAGGHKLLIDCGMFQERAYAARNWEPSPVPPAELDAVLLTHVHIDHSGLIPKLGREGFTGPIYCTRASAALADVVLRDAAEIQTEDAAYKKRRHAKEGRRGKYPEVPLYTVPDVDRCLPQFQGVPYERPVRLSDALSFSFLDAGHILGSAMIKVRVEDGDSPRQIVFSGDVGQWDKPLIRDPTLFDAADYVVMESTYGDRSHKDGGDIESQLADVVNETIGGGGNLLIPTFAIERAQELMYHLGRLRNAGRIPPVPIFLDSPMAVDVTDIFRRFPDCLDEESWELIQSKQPPLRFPGLKLVRSVEDSKEINELKEPCIIMAGSGMCNAGRIKFHLRKNIERPASTVLFVGYQSHGTLGRQILEGKSPVRIHGRMLQVRARIAQIHGFSAHADREGLLRWVGNLKRPPQRVFLTHGEEQSSLSLADSIREQLGWNVHVPEYQEVVEA